MRGLLVAFAALLLAVAQLCGQLVQIPTHREGVPLLTITGQVINSVTGKPVPGALVRISGAEARSVMTGRDGRFSIAGVMAGAGGVAAERPGFEFQTKQTGLIAIEPSIKPLVLRLVPLASISGSVLDVAGEPIDGVAVECLRREIVNGHKRWQPNARTSTDETGNFLLGDLAPGSYILRTGQTPVYSALHPKLDVSRYIYPAEFYPSTPNADSARLINLTPGREMKTRMALRAVRAVHLSFSTTPAYDNLTVNIGEGDWDGLTNEYPHIDSETRAFQLSAVPPGDWQMRVRSPSSRGSEQLTGEVRLQVGREDITNLNVPLSRLTDIQMFEGGPVIAGWMGVELHSSDGRVISSERDQQGEIWFRAVEPGSYRVVSFPIDACVTSLSSGGLDLLQHELVVTSGASIDPIQVAGGPGCASLTVTTNYKTTCDAQRTDLMLVCTSAAIVVTSNLKGFEPRLFGAEGMPLPSRQPALPEGEYQFYAFDNVTNLEYANTEVLRKFKSQTVFLHAGQTASIQLAVNKRPTL